jgi:imidazolonepropionase-like amidohydrolase
MRKFHHLALALVASALTATAAEAATTVIHAGHLMAEPGKPVRDNQSIVIENGKITAIKDGFVAGDTVVDLSQAWVMPGLIDMHSHVSITMDIDSPAPTSDFVPAVLGRGSARVLATIPRAQTLLGAGFTTLRNLGDPASVTYDLANAIKAGIVVGPTIIASEPQFHVAGGDYDAFTWGERQDLEPLFHNRGTCSGVVECARVVREEVHRGAGVIKMRIAAQPLLDAKSGPMETQEELDAIVSTAHRLNRRVATHVVGDPVSNQMAIDSGTDTIEHGPLTDANIAAMVKRHTGYTCTLLAAKTAEKVAIGLGVPPGYYDKVVVSVGKAYRAGVPILFGSDAPVMAFDKTPEEFVLMQQAGLPAVEALKSATVNAATYLGMSDTLGSIAPGKTADIIALPADPVTDLHVMAKVGFVMKGGKVFKPWTAPAR